jgi:DNA invertase Pin-like site-specific DNA recombinase
MPTASRLLSVTQSFNTSPSMGRLTLNVLLSFARFERELIGERVRDKIAASKRKGLWVGGGSARLCGRGQEDRDSPSRGCDGARSLI